MKTERGTTFDINHFRELGQDYCKTDGSEHYQEVRNDGGIDAIEIAILNDTFEDFAITNVLKYIIRFKKTRNIGDLKKVSDYAHLLCGVEIHKATQTVEEYR